MDGLMTYSSSSRVKFMISRFYEMEHSLERARANIDIALEAFAQKIDIRLTSYNRKLNKILLFLTLITILSMPFSVIGGIMGMNVFVPGQPIDEDDTSYTPFYSTIGAMVFVALLIFCLIIMTGTHRVDNF